MRVIFGACLLLAFCAATVPAGAQQVDSPTGQKTLAATINVYVFPTEGQDSQQQSTDEAACYNWAVENTGTDPFALQKEAQRAQKDAARQKEEAQDVGRGSGARGAVRGAAVGALIGEIASDDAGKGAAYGAAAGAVGGRRRGRAARGQAEQSAEQQAKQAKKALKQEMQNFKKAFAVCLEAKDYMVRW
jgi:hypothetical protein